MIRNSSKLLAVTAMGGLCAVLPQAARAQAASTAPTAVAQDDGLADIVVTAQKRTETLQNVPISITAIGADALATRHINAAEDLVSAVPNLKLSTNVGPGTPIFALRGVALTDYGLNQNGPVATYYDEVYKGNFAILGVQIYDLDRVEVLRGPQGTLYGKNTTGGAINLISKKPEFNTSGDLNVGYGNYNRFDVNGAAQTALSDTLAVRAAFTYSKADGWFKNALPGGKDLSGVDQYAVRLSLLYRPSDDLEIIIRGATSLQTPQNYGVFGLPLANGIGGGAYAAFGGMDYFRPATLGKREGEFNYTPGRYARATSVEGTLTWKVSNDLTLTSITSYDFGSLNFGEDSDGAPTKALEVYYVGRTKQFTQDLRIANATTNPFNFVAGVFYDREQIFNFTDFRVFNDLDVTGDGRINAADCVAGVALGGLACRFDNDFDQTKDSLAAYVDANYAINDRLKVRGGLRFTYDKARQYNIRTRLISVDNVVLGNVIPGSPTNPDATTQIGFSATNLSGKIGLDYRADFGLFYGLYSRGYRASSFNSQIFFSPAEIGVAKPEFVDAFEAGFKSNFADRRIQVNVSGFLYKYRNQQFINFDSATGIQQLLNIDKSRIFGGELELRYKPTSRLILSGSVGALNSRIEKGLVKGVDVTGGQLVTSPHWSLAGAADWTPIKAEWGDVSLHGDVEYTSGQYFEQPNEPDVYQGGYAVGNAQIRWDSPSKKVGASFWVKNLTDSYFYTARIDVSGFGFIYNQVNPPRTFGGTLEFKF